MSKLLQSRRGHDSEQEYDSDMNSLVTDSEYESEYTDESSGELDSDSDDSVDESFDSDESGTEETGSEEDISEESAGEEAPIEAVNVLKNEKQAIEPGQQSNNKEEVVDCDFQDTHSVVEQQLKEKRIKEQREYRRKLIEDPSFVPYVGAFWNHDDRYREDALVETRFTPNDSSKPTRKDSTSTGISDIDPLDPLMNKKWDHDGFEELKRIEEEEKQGKTSHDRHANSPQFHSHSYMGRGRGSGRGMFKRETAGRGSFGRGRPFDHKPRIYHLTTRQNEKEEEFPSLSSTTTQKEDHQTNTINKFVSSWANVDANSLVTHENGGLNGILTHLTKDSPPDVIEAANVVTKTEDNAGPSTQSVKNDASVDVNQPSITKTETGDKADMSNDTIDTKNNNPMGWGEDYTIMLNTDWAELTVDTLPHPTQTHISDDIRLISSQGNKPLPSAETYNTRKDANLKVDNKSPNVAAPGWTQIHAQIERRPSRGETSTPTSRRTSLGDSSVQNNRKSSWGNTSAHRSPKIQAKKASTWESTNTQNSRRTSWGDANNMETTSWGESTTQDKPVAAGDSSANNKVTSSWDATENKPIVTGWGDAAIEEKLTTSTWNTAPVEGKPTTSNKETATASGLGGDLSTIDKPVVSDWGNVSPKTNIISTPENKSATTIDQTTTTSGWNNSDVKEKVVSSGWNNVDTNEKVESSGWNSSDTKENVVFSRGDSNSHTTAQSSWGNVDTNDAVASFNWGEVSTKEETAASTWDNPSSQNKSVPTSWGNNHTEDKPASNNWNNAPTKERTIVSPRVSNTHGKAASSWSVAVSNTNTLLENWDDFYKMLPSDKKEDNTKIKSVESPKNGWSFNQPKSSIQHDSRGNWCKSNDKSYLHSPQKASHSYNRPQSKSPRWNKRTIDENTTSSWNHGHIDENKTSHWNNRSGSHSDAPPNEKYKSPRTPNRPYLNHANIKGSASPTTPNEKLKESVPSNDWNESPTNGIQAQDMSNELKKDVVSHPQSNGGTHSDSEWNVGDSTSTHNQQNADSGLINKQKPRKTRGYLSQKVDLPSFTKPGIVELYKAESITPTSTSPHLETPVNEHKEEYAVVHTEVHKEEEHAEVPEDKHIDAHEKYADADEEPTGAHEKHAEVPEERAKVYEEYYAELKEQDHAEFQGEDYADFQDEDDYEEGQYMDSDDEDDVVIILEDEDDIEAGRSERVLGITAPEPNAESSKPEMKYPIPRYSPQGGQHSKYNEYPKPRRSSHGQYDDWKYMEADEDIPEFYPANHPIHYDGTPTHTHNGTPTHTHNGTPTLLHHNGHMPYPYMPNGNTPYPMSPNHDPSGSPHIDYSGNTSPSHNYYAPNMNNYQNSPGYEANGMVYYGIDPSAMYPPQPYYYYPPPMPVMGGPSMMPYEPTEGNDYAEGWGSPPDITETEVEWRQDSVNNMNYYYYSHNHIY